MCLTWFDFGRVSRLIVLILSLEVSLYFPLLIFHSLSRISLFNYFFFAFLIKILCSFFLSFAFVASILLFESITLFLIVDIYLSRYITHNFLSSLLGISFYLKIFHSFHHFKVVSNFVLQICLAYLYLSVSLSLLNYWIVIFLYIIYYYMSIYKHILYINLCPP